MRIFAVFEFATGTDVFRIVEILPIGRKNRFVDVLLFGWLFGELNAALGVGFDAASVIKPHFAGSERATTGEVLASYDVVAVW